MKSFSNPAILLLVVIFAASCRSDKKQAGELTPECKKCSIMPANYEFPVKVTDRDVPFQFWEGASAEILDKSYMLGLPKSYKVSKEESRALLQKLRLNNARDIDAGNVMTYVVYSNMDKAGGALGFDNTIGAAIYYVSGSKLHIAVFKKDGGQLGRLTDFGSEVNSMPVMDFYKIGLIVKGGSKNVTSLVMSTANYTKLQAKAIIMISANTLTEKLNEYFSNNKLTLG